MPTRRNVLENLLSISAGMTLASPRFLFRRPSNQLTLELASAAPVKLPDDFVGLGYEMSSVATVGLLSPGNHRYVELISGLGRRGVLRVGGIVSDFTRYQPNGPNIAEPQRTVITDANLYQFAAFLRKIGWTAIWSLNFAQGTVQEAVAEAKAVTSALGPQLLAIEIGNEVDNYGHGQRPFRHTQYSYETYREEFRKWHAAILQGVPNIRFAAPDTASSVEWVERMAQDANGEVQLLTTHYYRNNQKRGSAEQLLFPDPRLKEVLARLSTAYEKSRIPWRMCETNSFSGGGLPGVSDTFIGALWVLDFMLLLAQYRCAGVNIETGLNQLGFISSYSPIQDDGHGVSTAGIPYYGMLAFARATYGCQELLPIDIDPRGINVATYVLGIDGKPYAVVAVNRDNAREANLSLTGIGIRSASVLRLTSPTPGSKTGVTFGGAVVNPDGTWKPKIHERIRSGNVTVYPMSAVVLRTNIALSLPA